MTFLKNAWIILLGLTFFIILVYSLVSRKPFKTLLLNAFLGVMALAVVNLTSKYTGAFIPLNEYTAVGSSVLGLPAVCGFLLLKFIFI